jgi:HAD superfamily hydrolase (TIGR01549 family)
MIKAIIFDVDDTLLRYSEVATLCFQQTALKLKLKKYSLEEIAKCFGTPSKKFIKKLWPSANVENFKRMTYQKILTQKVKPFPGAISIIKKISKKYKLGLLSSKSPILMYPHLKQIHLSKDLFEFIYSSGDVKYHKPDPRVFNKPLNKLKIPPNEILYVGDAIYDAKAAIAAKLNFVAILTGHYSKEDFQKIGLKNTNILKSLNELPKWLKKND